MTDREKFEAWAVRECFVVHTDDDGIYRDACARDAWAAWQAARRETAREIAEQCEARCGCRIVKCGWCSFACEIRARYGVDDD